MEVGHGKIKDIGSLTHLDDFLAGGFRFGNLGRRNGVIYPPLELLMVLLSGSLYGKTHKETGGLPLSLPGRDAAGASKKLHSRITLYVVKEHAFTGHPVGHHGDGRGLQVPVYLYIYLLQPIHFL